MNKTYSQVNSKYTYIYLWWWVGGWHEIDDLGTIMMTSSSKTRKLEEYC